MRILILLYIICLFSFSAFADVNNLLDRVKSLDPNLKLQQQNIETTNQERNSSLSKLFIPSLSFNATYDESRYDIQNTESNVIRKDLGLSMNYSLFSFGRDYYKYESDKHTQLAQKHTVVDTEIELESEFLKKYLSYIVLVQRKKVLKTLLELKTKGVQFAKSRYKSGNIGVDEVYRVEIDVENTRSEIADNEAFLNQSYNNIVTMLGDYKVDTNWPFSKVSITKYYNRLKKLKFYLDKNPKYSRQFNLEDAQNYQKKSSLSSLFGSIDLSLSTGWTYLADYDDRATRLSINLSIPLFENFNSYSTYKAQTASLYSQKLNTKLIQRSVRETFLAASKNLKISFDTYLKREKNLKLASKLFKSGLIQFRNGRISANDLLVEQNRLLRTQLLANEGKSLVHLAIFRLCHSRGSLLKECTY